MESIDLEHLLDKYYNGETSEAEENELKRYFNETIELPLHLKPQAALFKTYNFQQQIEIDKFLSDDWLLEKIKVDDQDFANKSFADKNVSRKDGTDIRVSDSPVPDKHVINKHSSDRRSLITKQILRIAAIVTLVAGAFYIGLWYKESEYQQRSEVANLRQELRDMKQTLIANGSPSDRITLVSQDFDPVKDKQVIDILITTLNEDANVNVRLAACAALYKFKNDDKARHGFIQSLQRQTDPMVQIFIIEILSGIKEKESIDELKRFQEKENLLPAVRKKAELGLTILREA